MNFCGIFLLLVHTVYKLLQYDCIIMVRTYLVAKQQQWSIRDVCLCVMEHGTFKG